MKKFFSYLPIIALLTGLFLCSCTKEEDNSNNSNSNSNNNSTFTNDVEVVKVKGIKIKMIRVEGGSFQMGAKENEQYAEDDEEPRHSVTLSTFYICETEVTEVLWESVMGGNPSLQNIHVKPKERVSWDDCDTFIKKLNQLTGLHFRLPTEAEWEYAARGGNESRGFIYAGSNNLSDVTYTTYELGPVRSKLPNELDIYDMSGSVWEWCYDWYGPYSSEAATNPQGPDSGSSRVIRGGSSRGEATRYCRVASRLSYSPDFAPYEGVGLRLAHSAQ